MAAGKQTVRRGGGGGPPSSGPSSLEVEDARPLLPGKPAARNGTVPSKAHMPSLRLMLCWSALFAVFLLAYHTSLMVGTGYWPSGLCTGLLCPAHMPGGRLLGPLALGKAHCASWQRVRCPQPW